MAVDLNVKVHLEEFKAKISEHTNLLNSKAKNLDVGKHSGEIESLNNMINMFVKSTKITQETLKGVNSNLRKFTDLIKELEAATSKTSDAYKEYDKQMKELASEREKLEEKRDALRKGVSVTSTGDIALRRGDLAKLYEEYQSSVTDANKIKGPKGKALQFQSFYSHYQNNASKLQNLDVKSNNSDGFLTIVKNEEARLAKELGDLDKSIEKLTDKINKLEVPEKMTNASSITEINRSFESTKSAGNLVQTVLQNQDDPKDTVSGRSVELNNRLDKQSGSINRAFKQFTLYAVALKTVKKALKEATATIKDLDKELTEQAMVTGMTREQTYGLMKTYQDLALATGATTKEVASVATEYIKQGKSIKEATILTEAAVSAAKVARVSVGDSVNYLTTALNGFRLSAEQAMLVSDKFAAVAASSATDYDELAIALSKVASQANLAGMSIDYTTALLTKGLETTREAPETMGTALKTIIARMRELGDYGETLEGDTDINNVETQLAYVDIALRNSQGELRSTEEVLDELGKKWDTLNKNQQAAIAKALAGTRQQSRLIAMMSDYERVTELQEISQRSAGATAAQASVYLEGMEASLNKITVAWEKIVTGLTDSEAIIWAFSAFGDILSFISEITSSVAGSLVVYSTLAAMALGMLGYKLEENRLAKEQLKLEKEYALEQAKSALEEKKRQLQEVEALQTEESRLITEKNITRYKQIQAKLAAKQEISLDDQAFLNEHEKDLELANKKFIAQKEYNLALGSTLNLQAQMNAWSMASYKLHGLINGVQTIGLGITKGYSYVLSVISKKKREQYIQDLKQQALDAKGYKLKLLNARAKMAESAAAQPIIGWVIAAAILGGAVVGTLALAGAFKTTEDRAEKSAKNVNKLSNEIYKLNEATTAINNITKSYDELDKKIIKTKKDQEEMNSLLDQAADKLSEEDKETYNTLTTNEDKKKFLELTSQKNEEQLEELRRKQIKEISKMSSKTRQELLTNTTNSEMIKAQSAIFAINNATLYQYIDSLQEAGEVTSEQAKSVEELTQNILSSLSAVDAFSYAQDESGEKIKALTNTIRELNKITVTTDEGRTKATAAEILTSDDYKISDKVQAFKQVSSALKESKDELEAFTSVYKEYELFQKMGDDVLAFIDKMGWGANEINKMGEGWKNLQRAGAKITESEYRSLYLDSILPTLEQTGGKVSAVIDSVFGTYLEQLKNNTEQYNEAYNAIVNIFSETMTVGMLNMGQNIEKLYNSTNSIYEKAAGWTSLKESEKMSFLQDNADLFKGDQGQELLAAFESGNYSRIEQALRNNDAFIRRAQQQLKQIEDELMIEEQRVGEDRNEAYIKYLKEQQKRLAQSTDLFKADLKLLLDQEQKQLQIYKDFLQKQQEELEESLDKRKEAYESYFEAIGQQEQDADYEEQRNRIITNLSKIATSTDFESQKQMAELQNELMELEKERQKELRERAQEALIEGIDKNVSDINTNIEKLLNNEGLLLETMKQNIAADPTLLSSILYASASNGQMTALQAQEFAESLKSTFGSTSLSMEEIKEFQSSVQNNAVFNMADGRAITLDSDTSNIVWDVLKLIMTKNGYGN